MKKLKSTELFFESKLLDIEDIVTYRYFGYLSKEPGFTRAQIFLTWKSRFHLSHFRALSERIQNMYDKCVFQSNITKVQVIVRSNPYHDNDLGL